MDTVTMGNAASGLLIDNAAPKKEIISIASAGSTQNWDITKTEYGTTTIPFWDNNTPVKPQPYVPQPSVPVQPVLWPNITRPNTTPAPNIISLTVPITIQETVIQVTPWLQYRITAAAPVVHGLYPRCSCEGIPVSSTPLTYTYVDCIIVGHREDVFIKENIQMTLPMVTCGGCHEVYYFLLMVKE